MPSQKPRMPDPRKTGPLPDDRQGSVVAERQVARTEPPRLYQVVLLNDDYTPMEFVVMVLQEHFGHDLETATMIMLKIHPRRSRGLRRVHEGCGRNQGRDGVARCTAQRHPAQCILEAA